MAKINEMEKISRARNFVHDEVRSVYCTFVEDNKKYIQIDTYGSSQRQVKNQPSQKIQFDRDMAIQLINILKEEFELEDNSISKIDFKNDSEENNRVIQGM